MTELNFTAQTPVVSTVHHPFGKPSGPGLWHMKGAQLPAYIQNVAHALIRSGSATGESDAIHKAVGIVKDWAAGHATHGKKVTPDVQAAASRAIAEWESLRGKRAAKSATSHSNTDGVEYMDLTNEHHTADGKFAGNTRERERILSIFQQQQRLPVTGKLDEETKGLLDSLNKAAND